MNKYLLLNHGRGGTAEMWDAYFQMLSEGGHLIGGSAIGSGVVMRDGDSTEAKSDTLTGYIVIKAESLEKARKIALNCPVHQTGGIVELFPLIETES